MRTMAWHNEGRVSILVQSEASPTNHEWLAYLNAFTAHGNVRVGDRCLVIYTQGGAPSGAQRRQLEESLRNAPRIPTALLTASALVRAVGAVIKFFSPALRMFPPADEQKAFEYLGLTPAEQQRTRALRAKLEADLDVAAHAA